MHPFHSLDTTIDEFSAMTVDEVHRSGAPAGFKQVNMPRSRHWMTRAWPRRSRGPSAGRRETRLDSPVLRARDPCSGVSPIRAHPDAVPAFEIHSTDRP